MKNRFFFIIILFFVLGFFYRLFLSSFATNAFIWDMSSFSKGAGEILNGQIIKDCCYKTQGYSLVLAGIYYLFGFENLFAVRLFQIFLDLVNALLVFGIAKKMFGRKAALVSYILYILNPFTAAYTGLALSEIVTLFYIVSI
ncbi:glycosyltransferase family 39 protein, partial [Candidatus Microgenomates bacterium]|nr:glycosyltransferase family 39 protein [Candidatus Microgenomates bacterium]